MASKEKNTQEIETAKKLNHVPWCEEYEKMISGMLYVKSLLSNSLALLHWAVLKDNWRILLLSEIADTFTTQYN